MCYRLQSILVRLFSIFWFIKLSDAIRPSLSDIPERNLTQYVRPLMGTEAGGHGNSHEVTFWFIFTAFAGSTIPFGMAKAVPDSLSNDNAGGFVNNAETVIGIGQLHDSGTGGEPSLGNFPIWINNCTSSNWESCPVFWKERRGNRIGQLSANVGKFGIEIDTGFYVGIFRTGSKIDSRNDIH